MKVAMMQPAFLPWQGFFGLIHQADVFVLLDDFQFSVQSYHQRNRLFTSAGQAGWCTVPVLKSVSFGEPLNRTRIDESGPWRRKMLKRLEQNYRRAPCFAAVFPRVEAWLESPWASLAEQNIAFINLALEMLGWNRELRLSSGLPSGAARSERVLELLRWCGATRYYAARGSAGYMLDDGLFPVPEIELRFQDFSPRRYPQAGSPNAFVPSLSVLDAFFNVGPAETGRLIAEGNWRWLSWDDIMQEAREGKGAPSAMLRE